MGRYFLDLVDGHVHRDDVGRELADREAIRAAAAAAAAAVLASHLSATSSPPRDGGAIEVRARGEDGIAVLVLTLEMD